MHYVNYNRVREGIAEHHAVAICTAVVGCAVEAAGLGRDAVKGWQVLFELAE